MSGEVRGVRHADGKRAARVAGGGQDRAQLRGVALRRVGGQVFGAGVRELAEGAERLGGPAAARQRGIQRGVDSGERGGGVGGCGHGVPRFVFVLLAVTNISTIMRFCKVNMRPFYWPTPKHNPHNIAESCATMRPNAAYSHRYIFAL